MNYLPFTIIAVVLLIGYIVVKNTNFSNYDPDDIENQDFKNF